MKKLIPIILAALLLFGCGQSELLKGGSGLLETDEVIVSAESSGRVIALNFDEGDFINRGDTLLLIDPSRLMLQMETAIANLKVVKAKESVTLVALEQATETLRYTSLELERLGTLKESGTATARQFDKSEHDQKQAMIAQQTAKANLATIKAEVESIEAQLKQIEREIEDCYPLCSSSGTIVEKFIESGELLAAGKPIARIASLDTLWVKVYLPAGQFAQVKIGDAATVDTESGESKYQGKIIWTSDEAEFTPKNVQTEQSRANLVYAVKVQIPNSDGKLKIGMPVYVTLDE